jgi:hypothetical protein
MYFIIHVSRKLYTGKSTEAHRLAKMQVDLNHYKNKYITKHRGAKTDITNCLQRIRPREIIRVQGLVAFSQGIYASEILEAIILLSFTREPVFQNCMVTSGMASK